MLSRFSRVQLLGTLWTIAHQASLSVGIHSLGKNTGAGYYTTGAGYCTLLQGIFLMQVSNHRLLCLLQWQTGSLPSGKPFNCILVHVHVRLF